MNNVNQPPQRLCRTLCSIDELAVGYTLKRRRWPLWRQRLALVHGSGCSADSWRYQIDGLSHDFDVVAVDLPGHGSSEPVSDPSVERYATTVMGVIQRIGRRKVVLAGHSMGGAVALQVALTRPELLKGLILIGTAAYLDRLALTPDIFLWTAATMPHKFKGMFFSGVVTEDALAIAGADIRRCRVETVMDDFAVCRHFDFKSKLKALNLPTLILCGDEDHITPVHYSKRLQQEIPGSTLMLIQKAGHMLPLESPDRVNAAIREFIQRI